MMRWLLAGGWMVMVTQLAWGQDIRPVLNFLPESANVVAVVRVQEILQSPRAKQEQWAKKDNGKFLAGGLDAGASAALIVRGMEFHGEDSELTQTVSVVSFAKPISLTLLSKQEEGHIEKIAGKSAVHSAQRGYFVALEPNILGNLQPSYRQNVSRWVRGAAGRSKPVVSSYLAEAVASDSSHVVLVYDLSDAVDPHILRERLTNFAPLVAQTQQIEPLAKLLEQLQGIRLMIQVTENIEAKVAIDFASTPNAKLADFVKPLLIEVLARAGASIDELETASGQVDGKTVSLAMKLSDSSARQVLSLAFASASGADLPGEDDPNVLEASAEKRALAATKNYVSAVNRLVDDLQTKSQKTRNYEKTVTWHESYAKRIDQLTIKDVDLDALAYGSSVSSKLRALAVSLKGVPLEINRLQRSVTYDVEYTPWAAGVNVWGGAAYRPPNWNVRTNQGEIQAKQAEAIAAGEKARYEVWKMLAEERQTLRVKLREKYNLDFE